MPAYVTEARPFYRDRQEAGRRLAEALFGLLNRDAVVLAIPRGGVPVAVEVARTLGLPLDVLVTRKIQIPQEPEAGYGAVAEDGTIVLNEPLVERLGLTAEQVQRHATEVRAEIGRRLALYREISPAASLKGKTAVLVDDGLASGFTMMAAVQSVRKRDAAKVIVAVPVASQSALEKVGPLVDDVVCPVIAVTPWFAMASYYLKWHDLTDEEVLSLLARWQHRRSREASPSR